MTNPTQPSTIFVFGSGRRPSSTSTVFFFGLSPTQSAFYLFTLKEIQEGLASDDRCFNTSRALASFADAKLGGMQPIIFHAASREDAVEQILAHPQVDVLFRHQIIKQFI